MEGGPSIQDVEHSNEITVDSDTMGLIQRETQETEPGSGCGYTLCHPRSTVHRFIALVFMCFLGFGSYFCYDNPAALQDNFTSDLNISATEFTALYSVYSWPNVVLCFIGGFLIDRVFGIRLGTNIYMALTLAGQVVFAAGALVDMFWLMCVGRFIFGIGAESLAVAQNNYAVLWFKGRELNMVFGLQLSLARVGSGVNLDVMPPLYNWISGQFQGYECLGIALFIATLTCIFSMICSLVLGILDKRAERILKRTNGGANDQVSLRDIKDFGLCFWLVSVICVTYYVAIFPFVALGTDFFETRFHLTASAASQVNSVVYLLSAVASPVFGFFVDMTGRNLSWISAAVATTLFSHVILAFTQVEPYVGVVLMSLGYSTLASSLWPLVSLMVADCQLGTAYGVCQSIQNLGLAVISIITGIIVDKFGYVWLEVFFISSLTAALISTIILWILDRYKGGILNMSPSQRKNHLLTIAPAEIN